MTTTIKERPILMSAPMVRAILAGRKTMTRRIVKPQPTAACCLLKSYMDGRQLTDKHGRPIAIWPSELRDEQGKHVDHSAACPYGSPGDRLWVRETFLPCTHSQVVKTSDATYACFRDGSQKFTSGEYFQDSKDPNACVWPKNARWKPSIHMPRWASRITLQVEAVRVERLQEIAGQDARAEGCEPDWEAFEDATCDKEGWDEPEEFDEECEVECDWVNCGRRLVETHEHKEWESDRTNYALRLAFGNLWESINGDGSWERNCWVWVVSFSVVNP